MAIKKRYTDQVLIEMLRSDDELQQNHAIKWIIRHQGETYNKVKKMIFKNNGNWDDFSEILQLGVVTLIEKVRQPEFTLTSKLSSFIYAICWRTWLNELRYRKKFAEIEELTDQRIGVEPSVDPLISDWDNKEKLLKHLLSKLPIEYQRVLTMKYWEDLSYREIEQQINSKTPVRGQVYRGLEKLRKMVKEEPRLRELLKASCWLIVFYYLI